MNTEGRLSYILHVCFAIRLPTLTNNKGWINVNTIPIPSSTKAFTELSYSSESSDSVISWLIMGLYFIF